jgi:hypothetical protein
MFGQFGVVLLVTPSSFDVVGVVLVVSASKNTNKILLSFETFDIYNISCFKIGDFSMIFDTEKNGGSNFKE